MNASTVALQAILIFLVAATPLPSAASPTGSLPEIVFGTGFEDSTTVQWIKRNGIRLQGLTVALEPTWVVAGSVSANMAYLQVPSDANGSSDYPLYSGIRIFGAGATTPVGGNCVLVRGTITQIFASIQLSSPQVTQLATSSCSTAIVASLVSLADIATDSNSGTAGDQIGPLANALGGVLVRIAPSYVVSLNETGVAFRVTPSTMPGPTLGIGNRLYTPTATLGQTFQNITGVSDQIGASGLQVLLPRSATDLN